jgi:hypothetical protein
VGSLDHRFRRERRGDRHRHRRVREGPGRRLRRLLRRQRVHRRHAVGRWPRAASARRPDDGGRRRGAARGRPGDRHAGRGRRGCARRGLPSLRDARGGLERPLRQSQGARRVRGARAEGRHEQPHVQLPRRSGPQGRAGPASERPAARPAILDRKDVAVPTPPAPPETGKRDTRDVPGMREVPSTRDVR